jgi:anthranilate phosphoribosyltransferase
MFDAAPFIREIGRGPSNSRSLSREQSFDLFDAILKGHVDDLSLGAVLIALRTKGESTDELAGALDAVQLNAFRISDDGRVPVVSIPSYNGARSTANLTALLACLLADAGLRVVVHGIVDDPKRMTTASIFKAMGMPLCTDHDAIHSVIARGFPAFVPLSLICPALQRLLDVRAILGVRSIAHTLAKMLNPVRTNHCLRLVSFTHPEFNLMQHDYFARYGGNALILRGTEGEVVASTKRAAQIDWVHQGICKTLVSAQTQPMGEAASLPPFDDASQTARWIQSVLAGERPVPLAIADQVKAIQIACASAVSELV